MPLETKIYLIDDDPDYRDTIKMVLEGTECQVLLEAGDMETAIDKIKQAKELGVRIVILDGNLIKGVNTCSDGHKLATSLRENIPTIKIVAHSGEPNSKANYGDAYVDKNDWKNLRTNLVDKITSL